MRGAQVPSFQTRPFDLLTKSRVDLTFSTASAGCDRTAGPARSASRPGRFTETARFDKFAPIAWDPIRGLRDRGLV
jgi:hypothetical protein